MIKNFLFFICVFITCTSFGQIQVLKLIGKDSKDFGLGYGGFLKFAYPVSDASDISLEVGANVFQLKENPAYGWAIIPVKLGYRYTLNQTGTGFYVQPQVGYNVYGIDPNDNKFTGLILAGGAGYLFETSGKIQFDLGLQFESALHKDGSANYLALRLSHNFTIRRRNYN